MRWVSTPESVRAGEVSVLAIIETLLAMAGSVWLGVYFDSWWHVFIWAAIAPFLLLRTDESCNRGLRALKWIDDQIGYRTIFIIGVTTGLMFVGIKIGCTVIGVLTDFVGCIRAIIPNWKRAVFVLDFKESPEILPLPNTQALIGDPEDVKVWFICGDVLGGLRRDLKSHWRDLSWLLEVFAMVTITMIAVAYRLSLKSTALIWFPLIWALSPAKKAERTWPQQLRIERDWGVPQLVLVVSLLSLALLAFKYSAWAARYELAMSVEAWPRILGATPLAEALVAFIRPGQIPIWQVATAVNSLLGIGAYVLISYWLARYKNDDPPRDSTISTTLASGSFVRRLLSSYVILCNLYMAGRLAMKLPVPSIDTRLFPWV